MRSQRIPSAGWGTDTSLDAKPVFALPATTGATAKRPLAEAWREAPRRRVEDQAGFEPATGICQRVKNPRRSAATVTGPKLFAKLNMETTAGVEPAWNG